MMISLEWLKFVSGKDIPLVKSEDYPICAECNGMRGNTQYKPIIIVTNNGEYTKGVFGHFWCSHCRRQVGTDIEIV